MRFRSVDVLAFNSNADYRFLDLWGTVTSQSNSSHPSDWIGASSSTPPGYLGSPAPYPGGCSESRVSLGGFSGPFFKFKII